LKVNIRFFGLNLLSKVLISHTVIFILASTVALIHTASATRLLPSGSVNTYLKPASTAVTKIAIHVYHDSKKGGVSINFEKGLSVGSMIIVRMWRVK